WVSSFSKAGKPLVVHIPTQKEFYGGEIVLGLLITKVKGLYGAYGPDGEIKIPFAFDGIELPNENSFAGYNGKYLISVKQGQKGIIDVQGNVILRPQYDDVIVYEDYFVAK